MSLYIKNDNQALIWKTIHKTPLIDNFFRSYPPGSQEVWFRNIIKIFHIRNPNIINQDNLSRINRDTIAYMVNDLKQKSNPPILSSNPLVNYQEPTTEYSRNSDLNTKDEFAEKFTNRQKEYETMMKKPETPEIQFTEKLEDGVINNMDELIQKQLKEREMDMLKYAPTPPISTSMTMSYQLQPTSNKISIGSDIDHIESISLDNTHISNQKKVSFTLYDESTEIVKLENRIRELEKTVLQIIANLPNQDNTLSKILDSNLANKQENESIE